MREAGMGARAVEAFEPVDPVELVDPVEPLDPGAEARLEALARSRGGLRRVLAGLAAAFVARGQWDRLGYVRAGDYARERLGLSARPLHDLARVGRVLAERPRLEAALVSGTLPWSKVRMLTRFVGRNDEARWIAKARGLPVRALERRVRAVDRGALDGHDDEPSETVRLHVDTAVCFKWRRTCAWSAKVAGERVTPGTVLEMITAETLSALPGGAGPPPDAPRAPPTPLANVCAEHGPVDAAVEPLPDRPLPAFLRPLLEDLGDCDAFALDDRLRRVVRLEQRIDAQIAPLLRQLPSPAAFAAERLGMSPRKARALLRVERVGDVCPALHRAFHDGTLSWAKAQILAPLLLCGLTGDWRDAWVRFAGHVTVRRLEDTVSRARTLCDADPRAFACCCDAPERIASVEEHAAAAAREERQTCARSTLTTRPIPLRVPAPTDVAHLFRTVLCAVRRAVEAETGHLPPEDVAFEAMIDHALRTWNVPDAWLRQRARRGKRFAVFERDGWRCTVPGCTSQRNLHVHHVRFRSAGGGDEPANQTTLCAAHHLRGVHQGRVRIHGRAPDALHFELGVRAEHPPLARYRSGDFLCSP